MTLLDAILLLIVIGAFLTIMTFGVLMCIEAAELGVDD